MDRKFYAIYENIQKRVQQEELISGQKISELQLMKDYHCSRALIRTVISWCVLNNLFEVIPKSGTYVKAETQLSFRKKVELRTYLEKLACRLLIQKITTREFNRLSVLVDNMDAILDEIPYSLRKFSNIHYKFHFLIISMTNNEYLISAYLNLNLRSSYLFAEGTFSDVRTLIRSNKEHRQILHEIKNQNIEKCEALLEKHIWVNKKIPPPLEDIKS